MKIADESVEEFDEEEAEPAAEPLRDRLEAFALRGVERLRGAGPTASRASTRAPRRSPSRCSRSPSWPAATGRTRARRALVSSTAARSRTPTIGVELLRDIRGVFDALDVDRISSKELRAELIEIEGSPWSEWSKGSPISQRAITDRLKPYGIRKREVRLRRFEHEGLPARAVRGRLAAPPPRTPQTGNTSNIGSTEPKTAPSEPATESLLLPVEKARKPHQNADVAGVAGSDAPTGGPGCLSHRGNPQSGLPLLQAGVVNLPGYCNCAAPARAVREGVLMCEACGEPIADPLLIRVLGEVPGASPTGCGARAQADRAEIAGARVARAEGGRAAARPQSSISSTRTPTSSAPSGSAVARSLGSSSPAMPAEIRFLPPFFGGMRFGAVLPPVTAGNRREARRLDRDV